MTKKRNAALDALTTPKASPADIVPIGGKSEERASKNDTDVVRVMLYLPHKVKRVFDDMGYAAERRAQEFYVKAIEQFLRANGHGAAADLLIHR